MDPEITKFLKGSSNWRVCTSSKTCRYVIVCSKNWMRFTSERNILYLILNSLSILFCGEWEWVYSMQIQNVSVLSVSFCTERYCSVLSFHLLHIVWWRKKYIYYIFILFYIIYLFYIFMLLAVLWTSYVKCIYQSFRGLFTAAIFFYCNWFSEFNVMVSMEEQGTLWDKTNPVESYIAIRMWFSLGLFVVCPFLKHDGPREKDARKSYFTAFKDSKSYSIHWINF